MKRILVTLLLFSPAAQAEEPWGRRVQVPPDVRYQQSSEAQLRPQAEALQASLKPGARATPAFGGTCLVGPYLWARWKKQFPADAGVPATSRIPTTQGELVLQGRLFHKDPRLVGTVAARLRQELDQDGGYTLRKLTPTELAVFWREYPVDFVDPVWMLESANLHIAVVMARNEVYYLELLDENFGKKI